MKLKEIAAASVAGTLILAVVALLLQPYISWKSIIEGQAFANISQAISAIATLFAALSALYLGSSAQREKRTEDMTKAKISAAALIQEVRRLDFWIKNDLKEAEALKADDTPAAKLHTWTIKLYGGDAIAASKLLNMEHIANLAPLQNHVARRLSRVHGQMAHLEEQLKKIPAKFYDDAKTEYSTRVYVKYAESVLRNVHAHLLIIVPTLEIALEEFP